jgi:hypothetical protein
MKPDSLMTKKTKTKFLKSGTLFLPPLPILVYRLPEMLKGTDLRLLGWYKAAQ